MFKHMSFVFLSFISFHYYVCIVCATVFVHVFDCAFSYYLLRLCINKQDSCSAAEAKAIAVIDEDYKRLGPMKWDYVLEYLPIQMIKKCNRYEHRMQYVIYRVFGLNYVKTFYIISHVWAIHFVIVCKMY